METIGDRMRAWRRRRGGMSQKMLADRAGLSQQYISAIESGERPLDRKSTQVAIASVLNISVPQLLGLPGDPTDPMRARAEAHLPDIRSLLVELAAGEQQSPKLGIKQLRQAVEDATQTRVAADYASLARKVPDLLSDSVGYGADAADMTVEVLFSARALLKAVGQHDLAREAAAFGVQVARSHDNPAWTGEALYSWIVSFPPENAELGARMAARAASDLQGVPGRPAEEVYGHLHLMCALQAAITSRPVNAWEHLGEAADVATSLGQPELYGPNLAGFNGQWFGPTNLDVWRVAIAAELGEPSAALDVARRIDLGTMPVPNRLVYYWIDLARALAADGQRDRDAMHALAQAERSAPQHFRFNPVVRNLVGSLIRRAKRRAVAAEFATLARNLGLDPL